MMTTPGSSVPSFEARSPEESTVHEILSAVIGSDPAAVPSILLILQKIEEAASGEDSELDAEKLADLLLSELQIVFEV